MEPGDRLIKRPTYLGGKKAMSEFIQKNIIYPEEALKAKVEGMVMVYIDIDITGSVVKTRVKKKLGFGCDEEAIRVVSLLKFFVEKKRKVRITHHKNIKVHFRLPKEKTKPIQKEQSMKDSSGYEIVYTYVPSKKS